jgi:hypothetical protein
MAKDGTSSKADKGKDKGDGPAKKASKPDAQALALDVKEFASKLGFVAGGGSNEFDDFAPQKAKQRINPEAVAKEAAMIQKDKEQRQKDKKQKGAAIASGAVPGGKAAKGDGGEKEGGKAKGSVDSKGRPIDPRLKERNWNVGAGPRPGAIR